MQTMVDNPEMMARAVRDLEEISKYILYAVGFIGFIVWLMLRSAR